MYSRHSYKSSQCHSYGKKNILDHKHVHYNIIIQCRISCFQLAFLLASYANQINRLKFYKQVWKLCSSTDSIKKKKKKSKNVTGGFVRMLCLSQNHRKPNFGQNKMFFFCVYKKSVFSKKQNSPLIPVWCDIFLAVGCQCSSAPGPCLSLGRSAASPLAADRWTHTHLWHKRLQGDLGDS